MTRTPKNEIGAAELQVGQAVYLRIEKLIGSEPGTPDARELSYLSHLAESVEELGGYDGPREIAHTHQDTVDDVRALSEPPSGREIAEGLRELMRSGGQTWFTRAQIRTLETAALRLGDDR